MSHRTLGIIVCSLSVALLGGCASSGNGVACPKSATNAVVKSEEVPAQTAQDAPAAAAQADRVDASGLFGASEADDALRHSQKDADLMLFESWPDETTLDNDFIANVVPVWIEAIESAQKTLDFEEFYAIAADDSLPKTAATQALTKVIDAVKAGAIKHFFLVGGCDGARPGRNYYTEFVKQTPADTVVLTLACGKYRFNDLDLGTIGGLPRIMDMGQCNDAYSAIQVAVALAKAFDCGVNDLPLSMVLSWYEQKAVCILLTLLSLGIKNIYLGPTLPAFVSKNVLNYLVENFNITPTSTPEADLKKILG